MAAICGPVKRAYAREPVRRATAAAPEVEPALCEKAASIASHSDCVDESAQMGQSVTANASERASAKRAALAGGDDRVSSPACVQYTEPCCCPEHETAATRPSSPVPLSSSKSASSARSHMVTGLVTTPSLPTDMPALVPYSGKELSKLTDVAGRTGCSRLSRSTPVIDCVERSRPR